MSMSMGPSCCCGGIGISSDVSRFFTNFTDPQWFNKQPCWTGYLRANDFEADRWQRRIPFYLSHRIPFYVDANSHMGWDAERGLLMLGQVGYGSTLYPGTVYLPVGFTGWIGFTDLKLCSEGESPMTVVADFDDPKLDAIGQAAFEGVNVHTWPSGLQAYSVSFYGLFGYGNGRYYGAVKHWRPDSAYSSLKKDFYRIFSFDRDGNDFRIDEERESAELWYAYVQGTQLLVSYNDVIPKGNPNLTDKRVWHEGYQAVTPGGQRLGIISGDLKLEDASVVHFAYDKIGGGVSNAAPWRIGWDARSGEVVVTWTKASNDDPYHGLQFSTYIAGSLTGGNIVGQSGVRIFDSYTAGNGTGWVQWTGPSSISFRKLIGIPGRYPEPIDFAATPPPPPPPPPPPTCETFDCQVMQDLFAVISELPFYYVDVSARNDGSIEELWTLTFLNGPYQLQQITSIDNGPCQGLVLPGKMFSIRLGAQDNYQNPGTYIGETTFADQNIHTEYFCYGIIIGVECIDDEVKITSIVFEVQIFTNHVGGGPYPPPAATVTSCVVNSGPVLPSGGKPVECGAGSMNSTFETNAFVITPVPAFGFMVSGAIGPIG